MSKVVLVTGASSGMGHEAAILLAKEGHHVYAGARRVGRMADLADHGITAVELDVTKGDDNERVVNQVIEGEGRIDILINNAGFGLYGPVEDVALEDARYQFEVNLFGLAHLTQLVLPHMREQGSGRIVNISSVGGRVFSPFGAWYHATKHALEGWSDCLRLETAPFNIQVVLVEPGLIKTDFGDVAGAELSKHGRQLRLPVPAGAAHQDEGEPARHGPRHRRQEARQGVRRGRPPLTSRAADTSRECWRGRRCSSGSGSATGSTSSCCASPSDDRSKRTGSSNDDESHSGRPRHWLGARA